MISPTIVQAQTAEFFARHAGRTQVEVKEIGWSGTLWRDLHDAGLIPGGSRAKAPDQLSALLRASGRHGASLPLAEAAIASWMLRACSVTAPSGLITVVPRGALTISRDARAGSWRLSGSAERVPWASQAAHIVAVGEGSEGTMLVCVAAEHCRITPARNLAYESRDSVDFDLMLDDSRVAVLPKGMDARAGFLRGAHLRAVQIAGALELALDLSVAHARERRQFGRRIGEFQAIQHELARQAGETASAVAAALSAAGRVEGTGGGNVTGGVLDAGSQWAMAAAKIRAAEAAREAALIAHQVHGAIGLTDAHPLHQATLRLWAWREEYGNEVYWSDFLGRLALLAANENATTFWESLVDQDDMQTTRGVP